MSDPTYAGFEHWTSEMLTRCNEDLSAKVGKDGSARTTLAEFTNYRFRLIRRESDGPPELHENEVDVVFVQDGIGSLMLGGSIADKAPMVTPSGARPVGEWVGSALSGGQLIALKPGDILHIPAGIPHSFLVPAGCTLTYVLVKMPK